MKRSPHDCNNERKSFDQLNFEQEKRRKYEKKIKTHSQFPLNQCGKVCSSWRGSDHFLYSMFFCRM